MENEANHRNTSLYRRPKTLLYLMAAAVAITLTGSLNAFTSNHAIEIFFKIVVTLGMIGTVYSFNDIMDNKTLISTKQFNQNLRHYFCPPFNWSILLLIGQGGLYYYSNFFYSDLSLSFSIIAIGICYSIEIRRKSKFFKIKNVFLFKNLFIAIGWANLIFLGSVKQCGLRELILACFVLLQVLIGSIIRDLDDIEDDLSKQVSSFPVILGTPNTLFLLNCFNLASLLFILISSIYFIQYRYHFLATILAILWRGFTLYQIKHQGRETIFLQTYNLATCVIIFFSQAILL